MSWWGTLDAEFVCGTKKDAQKMHDVLKRARENRTNFPTGSEYGPEVRVDDRTVSVYGRLRDVTDIEDSPAVLAWFTRRAQWEESAKLTWELDSGPRYRYEWKDGHLTKLKGVLDQ